MNRKIICILLAVMVLFCSGCSAFLLSRDEAYQLDYIGQMVSKRDKTGNYGSFQVCNPFKLLIVTENIPIFADKKKLNLIFKEIEKQVRSLCPTEEKVMLFVSPVIEPQQDEIIFYAEMDLRTNTQKVKWQEDALRRSGFYEKTIETATLTNVSAPDTKDLDVLRKTIAKKINLLPFKVKKESQNISFESPKKEISFESEEQPSTSFTKQEGTSEEELLDLNDEPFENPQFLIPEPKKNYQQPTSLYAESSSPVMHLCILSKIKREAVPIKAIVHIQDNTYNQSFTNLPLPLKIEDHALKSGWYQITGMLNSFENLDSNYYGSILPSTIQNYDPKESETLQ